MATFAEMKTDVSEGLLDENNVSISEAKVAAAINDAIRYYKTYRFWFNTVEDDLTIAKESEILTLPADYLVSLLKDDGFNIEYSSQKYPLTKVSIKQFDTMFLDNGFGMPRYYAKVADEYKVYPKADRDYTVNTHYLKDYDKLVDDGDTNDFTDYADQMIVAWATANLTAKFKQDDKMETYYRNRAGNEYGSLKDRTNKNNNTGRTEISSYLI